MEQVTPAERMLKEAASDHQADGLSETEAWALSVVEHWRGPVSITVVWVVLDRQGRSTPDDEIEAALTSLERRGLIHRGASGGFYPTRHLRTNRQK